MSRRLGGESGCGEEATQPPDGEQRAETSGICHGGDRPQLGIEDQVRSASPKAPAGERGSCSRRAWGGAWVSSPRRYLKLPSRVAMRRPPPSRRSQRAKKTVCPPPVRRALAVRIVSAEAWPMKLVLRERVTARRRFPGSAL